MIKARVDDDILIVLEPGNIDMLEIGKPIFIPIPAGVDKVLIAYTPDVDWVMSQVRQGKSFSETLENSLTRPEVHTHATREPQELKDVKI